jgi:hypothetical protein
MQGVLPTLRDLHAALATVLRAQERRDEARREEAAARKIDERLAATIPDGSCARSSGAEPGSSSTVRLRPGES